MKSIIVFAHRNRDGKVVRVALDAANIMQLVEEGGKVQIVNDMGQAMLAENDFGQVASAIARAGASGYDIATGTDELCAQPQILMPDTQIVVPNIQ